MTGRGTGNLYIDVSNKVCPTTIQHQQEKQSQAWLNAQSWHTNTKRFKKHTWNPPKQTKRPKRSILWPAQTLQCAMSQRGEVPVDRFQAKDMITTTCDINCPFSDAEAEPTTLTTRRSTLKVQCAQFQHDYNLWHQSSIFGPLSIRKSTIKIQCAQFQHDYNLLVPQTGTWWKTQEVPYPWCECFTPQANTHKNVKLARVTKLKVLTIHMNKKQR